VKGLRGRQILLSLCVLALARGGWAALGPRYGGELTVGLGQLPARALVPWIPRDEGDPVVTGLVHEGLLRLDANGLPAPGLAVRWSAAAGGREWQLELAPGARFHDEDAVTAEAVVRSLRRFLRSSSPAARRLAASLDGGAAYSRGNAEELPGLVALVGGRVSLRFPEGLAAPLAPLAAPAAAIVGPGGQGCGPFVPALNLPGRSLALIAFGSHVRGRPYLERVTLKVPADTAAARADLRDRRLDVVLGEPGEQRMTATLILQLDPARPPFDRPSSRDAVASAVADAAIAPLLDAAEGAPGLLSALVLRDAAPLPLPSGAVAVAGRVTLAVAEDVPPLASQRVVATLDALGLRTTVRPVSPDGVMKARAQARLFLWSPEVPEPGLALRELAGLAPVSRVTRDAMEAAEWELDLDRRRAALEEAEAALRAERILVPLCRVAAAFAARPGVHGARLDAAGRLRLEDAWTEP
jgi:ABC-type transport system substrate-binding protein